MKNLMYLLLATMLIASSSCKKEDTSKTSGPCAGVVCYNGGNCLNGTCNCPVGYYGADCNQTACQHFNTADIQITNTKSNPYSIEIGGLSAGTIAAGSTPTFQLTAGQNNHIKATQLSGYILYPTIYQTDASPNQCDTWTWSF